MLDERRALPLPRHVRQGRDIPATVLDGFDRLLIWAAVASLALGAGCRSASDDQGAVSGSCTVDLRYKGTMYGPFMPRPPQLSPAGYVGGVVELCGEDEDDVSATRAEGIPPALALLTADPAQVYAPYGTVPQLRTHPVGRRLRERRFTMSVLRRGCRSPIRFRGRLVDVSPRPGEMPSIRLDSGTETRLLFADRSRLRTRETVAGQPLLGWREQYEGEGWRCPDDLAILVGELRPVRGGA